MPTIIISMLADGNIPVDQMDYDDEGNNCPLPTQDPDLNEDNKMAAVEDANYRDPASDDGFRVTELCANCGAYNQTEDMLECIGDESGDLGYCQIYKFVCAASHTCDKWVKGGPITSEAQQGYRDIL
jgi:hypothetical protein